MAEKTIASYASALGDWRAGTVHALDELVRATAPKATGAIKWGQLVYDLGGPMIFIKAASKHVTFGFWRGIELDDPNDLLEGEGDRMRHVKIREDDVPSMTQLRRWIKQAAALNAAEGDPTRRHSG